MSNRTNYCKRLLKKAVILLSNCGENETKDIGDYFDTLVEAKNNGKLLLDDSKKCKCSNRKDVILIDNTNYCCDCLCFTTKGKDEQKEEKKESEN